MNAAQLSANLLACFPKIESKQLPQLAKERDSIALPTITEILSLDVLKELAISMHQAIASPKEETPPTTEFALALDLAELNVPLLPIALLTNSVQPKLAVETLALRDARLLLIVALLTISLEGRLSCNLINCKKLIK